MRILLTILTVLMGFMGTASSDTLTQMVIFDKDADPIHCLVRLPTAYVISKKETKRSSAIVFVDEGKLYKMSYTGNAKSDVMSIQCKKSSSSWTDQLNPIE